MIAKKFKGVPYTGSVTEMHPATSSSVKLWHVVHEDGDEEDLNEIEMKNVCELYLKGDETDSSSTCSSNEDCDSDSSDGEYNSFE